MPLVDVSKGSRGQLLFRFPNAYSIIILLMSISAKYINLFEKYSDNQYNSSL